MRDRPSWLPVDAPRYEGKRGRLDPNDERKRTDLQIRLEKVIHEVPMRSEVVLSDGRKVDKDLGDPRVELLAQVLLVARHPVLELLHEHDGPALRKEDSARVGWGRRCAEEAQRAQAFGVDLRSFDAGQVGGELIL